MTFTTRALGDGDRQEAVRVEEAAAPGYPYLNDAWDYFLRQTEGDLTGVFLDEKLVGVGKLTRLFHDYGWLETLRVDPQYQGQGAGKAIYAAYLKEASERGLRALGMYTGSKNVISRHLAEKNGLALAGTFDEYVLPAKDVIPHHHFQQVEVAQAEAILSPHYKDMGGFVSLNQTYYPAKEGLGACMAANGWLYQSDKGDLIIVGARFQPERGLHVAFVSNDTKSAIDFALSLAKAKGSVNLQAMRVEGRDCGDLLDCGFEKSPRQLITLWGAV
ncbi:MAG: GNAT family N-acetyltransferase [Erysipelotrichaceae bacterium]|jgi:RimJ/RimL family protein N-acetyltransferase|nr:GNAT family N-acetyltransferase [Erysipelotrichaceae bacterium]